MPPSLRRLYVIGDSISIHYGPYLEKRCSGVFAYNRKRDEPGVAEAARNLDVPTGANGGDSSMVLAYLRYRRTHRPIEADVLLLNCGLHDIKKASADAVPQVPVMKYRENLRGIIAEGRAMCPRVVWVRITPVIDEIHNREAEGFLRFAQDVADYNAAADEIMAEKGVPTIDLHAFSKTFIPDGFIDHVHFCPEVAEKQAGFIFDQLRDRRLGETG